MKPVFAAVALATAGVSLSSCSWGGPGPRHHLAFVAHPYVVWYDGYYGSFYDGYWGVDGYFYYRLDSRDRDYKRGSRDYFRREQPSSRDFRRYEGFPRNPPQDGKMPHYPR